MANYFNYSEPEWERGKAEMKDIFAARSGTARLDRIQ